MMKIKKKFKINENLGKKDIKLRAFPYPYKAALSICSDIDCCDKETFIKIHRYLNTESKGLGLPVADSFFGIGRNPAQMAYFTYEKKYKLKDGEFIRQAIEDGIIDSLHSWGDFNDVSPKSFDIKGLASALLKEFESYNLKIKIWINHGDSLNYQNLKARLQKNYCGDDPFSPFYTGKILEKLGIKYYWSGELTKKPLSINSKKYKPFTFFSVLGNSVKNIIKILTSRKWMIKESTLVKDLVQPAILRDGNCLLRFVRYCNPKESFRMPATRNSLRYSLKDSRLKKLIKMGGYMILYTHLGRPKVSNYEELFQKKDQEALEGLAAYYKSGKIWVRPTIDLLNYWLTFHRIIWSSYQNKKNIIINLQYIDDPKTGKRLPEKEELSGLCFFSYDPENTKILVNGNEIMTYINPPDECGLPSVQIPTSPPPRTDLLV